MKIVELFEQDAGVEIRVLTRTNLDIFRALDLAIDIFHEQYGLDKDDIEEAIHPMDMALCLYNNDMLIGTYILRKGGLSIDDLEECDLLISSEEFEYITQGKGIEGVALALIPEYRKLGYGKKLIEHVRTLGYDYIWGQQLKSLNNLDHWLKRRKHVATCNDGELYITMERF